MSLSFPPKKFARDWVLDRVTFHQKMVCRDGPSVQDPGESAKCWPFAWRDGALFQFQ